MQWASDVAKGVPLSAHPGLKLGKSHVLSTGRGQGSGASERKALDLSDNYGTNSEHYLNP